MKKIFRIFLPFILIIVIVSCSPKIPVLQKSIALTFDDGPDSIYTGQVLSVLKSEKVKATFFLIGSKIANNEKVVEQIHIQGHCIGNHSFHHLDFWKLNSSELLDKEIEPTSDLICQITGIQPRLYRSPFGFMYGDFEAYLKAKGYYIISWDINPKDFELDQTIQEITACVVNGAKDKGIILMHCGNGDRSHTIKA